MSEIFFEKNRILENKKIAPDTFAMKIHAPQIAANARAGQFVMVYLEKGELLLPRPISLCDTNADADTIELVYCVVGKGTAVMAKLREGRFVKLLGPLGNGFDLTGKRSGGRLSRVALVGGGIGTPPIFMLAKNLAERGVRVDIFLGFRGAPILIEKFCKFSDSLYIATESGEFGHHGYVTEILKNWDYDEFMACGPVPLLRALKAQTQGYGVPCQICMEERMACGLGTCVGCVVKAGESYVRVCSEGPVFFADEVEI